MDGSCPWSQKWVYATGWQKEEDGKTLVCDKGDGGITRVFFRDLHLTFNFFLLFYKRFFKGVWSLVEGYFKQKYCHGCHTRFAVIFPFPPCRVSLLKTCRWHYSHPYAKQISCNVLWKQLWLFSLFCPKAKKFTKNFTLSNWWPWKMLKHKLLQVRRNWGEKYF